MTRIVMDFALQQKLGDLNQPIELCDEQGHVLACVLPYPLDKATARLAPQVSEEELDRREQEEGGCTTKELLNYLQSL